MMHALSALTPLPVSFPLQTKTHTDEAYTDELIEQILENYTFKCEPEIRLKLKHK